MQFRTIEISDPLFAPEGLIFITAKSEALKARADVSVYVPTQANDIKNISVIVLLHGVYGSHWSWSMKGNAHNILQEMMNTKESSPFILVMPSDGLWGDGSAYVPHAIQNFEQWIGEEIPSLIKQTIPAVTDSSKFFIAGLSMGGYGAFRIGLNFPNTYLGISSHSSITRLEQLQSIVEEDWSFFDESQFNIEQLINKVDNLPSIRFDCGLQDDLLVPNQKLHHFLKENHITHQYHEYPGSHDWLYWKKYIRETFKFFTNLKFN